MKRARHTKTGITYYNAKDKAEMRDLHYAILESLTTNDRKLIGGVINSPDLTIELEIEFIMSIPKSYSNKKKLELIDKPHIKTPDLDNLIKNVLDRGNDILWKDDKVIYSIKAWKKYGECGKINIIIKYKREM